MDIELVTDVGRLQNFVDGWEALAERASQPRAGGAIGGGLGPTHDGPGDGTARLDRHRRIAEVVGVLPFVAETMARGRLRLLPPGTDMMYGTVPIARARPCGGGGRGDRGRPRRISTESGRCGLHLLAAGGLAVGGRPGPAVCRARRGSTLSTQQLPVRLHGHRRRALTPGWHGAEPEIPAGRCGAGPAAARRRGFGSSPPRTRPRSWHRLPRLQTLYLWRQRERGGEGYRFDDDMLRAIGTAMELSTAGPLRALGARA